MAINNPYIPGDPYSYDLKWIVSKLKTLDTIYESIDSKIAEKIYQAFQESNLINFKTTEAMLEATLEDGAVVLTDGYHEPGDGGTMIYLIQGFTPEMCQLDYYLSLPGNKIAVPVVLFPYVTPIMFGAYGDGTADDTEAFKQALKMHKPVNLIAKSYKISDTLTIDEDHLTLSNGSIVMTEEVSTGFLFIDSAENVTVREIKFIGSGTAMPTGSTGAYTAIRAENANHLTVDSCTITNVSNGGVFVMESSYVTVSNNTVRGIANNDAYGAIVVGYGINSSDMGYQTILNNTIDGGHFGVEVQGWQHDVNISDNKIRNNYGYGIVCYRYPLTESSKFQNVQITNNLVENTHHNPNVGYYNGMAIYAQTIDKVAISDNIVNNALLDRPDAASPNRTLSPGAISISGSEEVTCTGNVVNSSTIDGIDVVDVSSDTIGNIISNNVVNNALMFGIYGTACQNVVISDNIVSGTSNEGITVVSNTYKEVENICINGNIVRATANYSISLSKGTGTICKNITVSGNTVVNHTSVGIGANYCKNLILHANVIEASQTVTSYAISATNGEDISILGNIVRGSADAKYYGGINANNSSGLISNNIIKNVDAASRIYSVGADVKLWACLDDVHEAPFTNAYSMRYNNHVEAPVYFTDNTIPSSGYHSRGSIAFNVTPATGAPVFWICTASGTPGTWVAGPTL